MKVVTLHPSVLSRYEKQIAALQETVGKVIAAGDDEAAAALRDLVEKVVVSRDHTKAGGVAVEITGRLNSLLGENA